MKKIFEHYDKNNNQKIDKEEFLLLAKDFLKYLNKKYEIDLLNNDPKEERMQEILGNLSKGTREDFIGKKYDLKEFTNELFDNMDVKRDNQISFIEFKNW